MDPQIKYMFESICFVFFAFMFVYSFVEKKDWSCENLTLKFASAIGIVTCIYSIAAFRSRFDMTKQNIVQYVLGVFNLSSLGFLGYFTVYNENERFWLFTCLVFFIARLCDLYFFTNFYVDQSLLVSEI